MNGHRIGERIPELDGLRGVAIALVMLLHFTQYVAMLPKTARATPS